MNRIALGLLLFLFLGRFLQPAPQEKAGVWLDVPFVKQTEDGCGSASISMVLQYWNAHGARIDRQRADSTLIQKQLYSPKARGIYASVMEGYLKGSGFRVFDRKRATGQCQSSAALRRGHRNRLAEWGSFH
jgi:hypothetical protein